MNFIYLKSSSFTLFNLISHRTSWVYFTKRSCYRQFQTGLLPFQHLQGCIRLNPVKADSRQTFMTDTISNFYSRYICYSPAGHGLGRHFQDRGHSFSPYGPTLSHNFRQNYNIVLNEVETRYILLNSDKNKDLPFISRERNGNIRHVVKRLLGVTENWVKHHQVSDITNNLVQHDKEIKLSQKWVYGHFAPVTSLQPKISSLHNRSHLDSF